MKKKFLALLVMCCCAGIFTASAQKIDTASIPAVVKTSFYGTYTNAEDVEWRMIGQNYLVQYEIADVDHKITYTPAGEVVASERELNATDLPPAVTAAVTKDFENYRIDGVDEITTNGVITYKVELDGDPDMNAWYSSDGKLIRKAVDE